MSVLDVPVLSVTWETRMGVYWRWLHARLKRGAGCEPLRRSTEEQVAKRNTGVHPRLRGRAAGGGRSRPARSGRPGQLSVLGLCGATEPMRCVCISVHMYVCMYASTYVHNLCIYVSPYVRICVCMHRSKCLSICMSTPVEAEGGEGGAERWQYLQSAPWGLGGADA